MNYSFPSEFVSPEEKAKPEYGISYFKAAWEYYGGWARFDDRQLLIRELRRWAMGLQSIDNMKPYFAIERADTSYATIDWSAPGILATYRDRIVQRIANIPFEISTRAIDPKSVDKRMDKELEIRAKMKLKPENEYFKEQFGVPIYEDEKLPEDEQELGLFMDLEYKMPIEISMAAALEWLMYLSGDKDLKMRLIKDHVDIGRAFLKVTYDDQNRPILKYVDPARFITSYSEKEDYSDIVFGMELKYKTIMEIKKECPDLSEEELKNIAMANMNRLGNNGTWNDFRYFPQTPFYYPLYYNYKVGVLEGDFLSLDYKGYDVYENFHGRKKLFDVNTKNPLKDTKKGTVEIQAQNLYTGSWIVDSNIIYNYGMAKDILRWKEDGKLSLSTRLPYIGYQPDMREMQNKGLVERMRPHAEQMHLAILKIQREMAAAAPSGKEIDIGNLSGIFLGKGKGVNADNAANPIELMKMYHQTGNLFVNKSKNGQVQNTGSTVIPIQQEVWNAINGYVAAFEFHKSILEMVIGGGSVANTGTPSPDALVGIQKMAAIAADNALGNTTHAYIMTIENSVKLLALYLQNRIEHDSMDVFAKGLGNDFVRAIKLTKQEALADYAIMIKYMPTQEQKVVLQGYIANFVRANPDRLSDAYLLETQMTNPMMAWAYLRQMEEKARKDKQKASLELSQANANAQAQAGTAVEQAKQQTYQMQAEAKMAEIAAQGDVDENLLEMEYRLKAELSAQEGQQDNQLAMVVNNQRTFQNSDLTK